MLNFIKLLNLLYDSDILFFKKNNTDIIGTFKSPYFLNNYNEPYVLFKFFNVKFIFFKPWDNDLEKMFELNEFSKLSLLFLKAIELGKNEVEISCYGEIGNTYKGGDLYIKFDNMEIYNNNMNLIDLSMIK